MALVALAATGSAARGSGQSNPFAGTFIGNVPSDASNAAGFPWSITIRGGKITGEKYFSGPTLVTGSFKGTVERSVSHPSSTAPE